MIDKELMRECLLAIKENEDTKIMRDAVETLLKIYRNILHNEDQPEYRKINIDNLAFFKKVWSLYPCREFMLLSGWIEVPGKIVFNSDENLVDVIHLLVQHRVAAPSDSEWVESSKYEGKSQEQLREEDLKRKAILERQKELDEYMKDKKYREDLARNVKAQISADREKRKIMFTKPVVGNKLVKGARIKTLHSGGCSSSS